MNFSLWEPNHQTQWSEFIANGVLVLKLFAHNIRIIMGWVYLSNVSIPIVIKTKDVLIPSRKWCWWRFKTRYHFSCLISCLFSFLSLSLSVISSFYRSKSSHYRRRRFSSTRQILRGRFNIAIILHCTKRENDIQCGVLESWWTYFKLWRWKRRN